VLAPDGGIGAMVYAPYGRTGVYQVQAALRMVSGGEAPAERLRLAKAALAKLPTTNFFAHNQFVSDHKQQGDAGFYDLLLNPIDRPFTVRGVAQLAVGAGLRLTGLLEPLRYHPEAFVEEPELRARLAKLDPLSRAAFAELWAGNIRRHVFYAVKSDNRATLPAVPAPDAIPVPVDLDGAAFADGIAKTPSIRVNFDGLAIRIALPPLAGEIARLIDGKRTIGDIHNALAPRPDDAAFDAGFAALYAALNGINRLFLRFPPG
jgi:hypothetical protein